MNGENIAGSEQFRGKIALHGWATVSAGHYMP